MIHHLRMKQIDGHSERLWMELIHYPFNVERKEHLRGSTKKVKLKNLHWSFCKSLKIKEICKSFGIVNDLRIITDDAGYGTGQAIVEMLTVKEAINLFEGLHGQRKNHMAIITQFIIDGGSGDRIKYPKDRKKMGGDRRKQRKQRRMKE